MNKQSAFTIPASVPTKATAMDIHADDNLVDVKALIRTVRRRFWLGLISALLTFLAVAVYTFQQTPMFSATTRLVLDTQQDAFEVGNNLLGLPANTAAIDTELEIMRSETLLQKVVPRLSLSDYAEFNWRLQDPSLIDTVTDQVTGLFSGNADAGPPPTAEQQAEGLLRYATFRLGQSINVARLGPTYVIDVTAESENPQLAADIANAVADQYLVEQLEAKLEATRRANDWLSDRLSSLKDEVDAKERAVEIYRNDNGLLVSEGSTLTEQEISDLTAQRSLQSADLSEAQARLTQVRSVIRSGQGAESTAEVLNSAVISQLRAQQSEVQRRRADLLTTRGPRHPDVLAVNAEAADITQQINSEVNRIVTSLENQVSIARGRLESIDRDLGNARGRLASNNRAEVTLRQLEREAEASRALYENFLEQFKQTSEESDLVQADARVLSSAKLPTRPSSPRTNVNLMLGLLMGLVVAGGLIFLAELGENHFSSGEEVERLLRAPALGSIPLLTGLRGFGKQRKSPADYAIENPLSAFSESIRNLRASIIFADLDNPAKTVAVCSSLPNEGKTMTTYALGRMSAVSGSRTLVIDGDFRRRQLTEATGVEPEVGLIEHLFGEVALEQALLTDEASGLDILPLSNQRNTPRDVFGSRSFDALLQRLEEHYDLIVIDTGPLLLMAESRVIVSKVDQVIVVAKWRSTTRTALKQTMGILNQFHANVAGVVLNFVDLRKKRLLENGGATYKAYSKYYSEGAV
ncbi:MAG: Wzz/FepE/Etk N-terminal domain-containing protein [Pseudomonadota bacterium]